MKRILILTAVGVAFLVAAYAVALAFGVLPKRDSDGLTFYGNVDIREVDLAFQVEGRVEKVLVDEGDRIKAGATLAQIDADRLVDNVSQAEAKLAEAQANLRRLRTGNRLEEIAQAKARVQSANADHDRTAQAYERRAPLVEEGAISQGAWEQTVSDARQAAARLSEAQDALDLLRSGAREEDISVGEAQLASARAMLDSAKTDLDDATLVAPAEGILRTRAVEPGAIVRPGETVFTLSLGDPVRIRAYVPEPDLSNVSPGMKVQITTDGSDTILDGRIGSISSRAEFTPKSVETEELRTDLVYRMRIIVESESADLRQGQPVTVMLPENQSTGQQR
ncbi:MAG: HlyD family efflux transporter periplasmic adaptor subunit [Henriciella sp.]|uniref:HlyD family efflux transporter periplasmic adaptor subunit n=1 Tax=Henriciella sp. TaxID=1968823 RepID=UPI003C74B3FD